MSGISGTWSAHMKSVLGSGDFTLVIAEDPVSATLTADEGTQTATNVEISGDSISFVVDVDKPMKLQIAWKLTAEGDDLVGTAKAGSFPAAKIRGNRA